MRRHRTYRAAIAWLTVGEVYHPYRLLKDKAAVLELIGQWDQAQQIYSWNVEIARQSCDDRILVEAQTTLASMLAMQGGFADAMTLLRSALVTCQRLADQTGICQVEFLIGTVHADQGDYGQAMERYQQSLAIARAAGDTRRMIQAIGSIGVIHHDQGDLAKAREYYEQWREYAGDIGDQQSRSYVINNLAMLLKDQGDYTTAEGYLREKVDIDQKLGDKRALSYGFNNLGVLFFERGDYGPAREYFQRKLRIAEELDDQQGIAEACGNLGNVCMEHGDLGRCREYFQRAVTIGRRRGAKYVLSGYLAGSAELESRLGNAEAAGRLSRESLALAVETGRKPVAVRCRMLQARLTARSDRPAAIHALESLLQGEADEEQQAAVCYELHRITGQAAHRERAAALYRSLAERMPRAEYRDRLQQLTSNAGA